MGILKSVSCTFLPIIGSFQFAFCQEAASEAEQKDEKSNVSDSDRSKWYSVVSLTNPGTIGVEVKKKFEINPEGIDDTEDLSFMSVINIDALVTETRHSKEKVNISVQAGLNYLYDAAEEAGKTSWVFASIEGGMDAAPGTVQEASEERKWDVQAYHINLKFEASVPFTEEYTIEDLWNQSDVKRGTMPLVLGGTLGLRENAPDDSEGTEDHYSIFAEFGQPLGFGFAAYGKYVYHWLPDREANLDKGDYYEIEIAKYITEISLEGWFEGSIPVIWYRYSKGIEAPLFEEGQADSFGIGVDKLF